MPLWQETIGFVITIGDFPYCPQNAETAPRFSVYLKGILLDDLEEGVRFIVKRHRPVQKTAAAESDPARLQVLVPAVHKTPVGKQRHTGRVTWLCPKPHSELQQAQTTFST